MGNPNLPTSKAVFEYTPEMVAEIEKCKNDILYFAKNYFYIIDPDEGKVRINLYDFQERVLGEIRDYRFNILLSPRQASKALALDTPIPTPNGWTTMGELKDGDQVYGRDGKPCNVVMAHNVRYDRPCYEIEFDNGEIIVADEDHNWFTQNKNERDLVVKSKGSVKTTKELLNNFKTKSGEPFYRIPSCINGLEKTQKELLIPPYVLGLWLGDGHTNGSRITVGNQYIEELTAELTKFKKYKLSSIYHKSRNIYSLNLVKVDGNRRDKGTRPCLSTELRTLNLMGNKHIPEVYMLGSRDQRMELLMGLIDSDGMIDKRGNAIFTNANVSLVLQVKELIESLGYKTVYKINKTYLNGVRCKDSAYVSFRPREYVCKLLFKKERIKINKINYPDSNKRNQWHYIKDIRPVKSVPVRCITVDSDDNLFLCGKTLIPTHNTTLMTMAALHEACFKDFKNIVIVANKESTAIEIFRRVQLAYEELPGWLKPGVEEYGKTSAVFTNGSRISISTTTGSAIRGTSLNLLIVDEMAFIENHLVEEFWKSVYPTISRAKTSKVLIASTPNGKGNLFYKLYSGAEKGNNGFHPSKIEWNEIPGRDEAWKEQQIKILGSYESFMQEFGNSFLDTGDASLNEELFDRLKAECKEPLHILKDGHYKIWEEYNPENIYAIGGDVSEGVGLDASVLEIFNITDPANITQAAEYHNNTIGPAAFVNEIVEIAGHWGNPLLLIERNNQGTGVCDTLVNTHMYQNLVSWGAKVAHKNPQNGMISHINTKFKAVTNQRYFVNETEAVTFRSIECLKEFKNFVRYPNGSWKAKAGEHDDRVMAVVWMLMSLYNEITEMYFEIEELDDCDKPKRIKPIDMELHKYRSSTSIYSNEEVPKIEMSNLAPVSFGYGNTGTSDIMDMMAAGWEFPDGAPYADPSKDISADQWSLFEKYF